MKGEPMADRYGELAGWTDRDLLDPTGDKIGKVDELYYDETTGQPEWLLVKTGLFGMKKTFVPASEVRRQGEDLVAPFSKDRVKDAPRVDDEEVLTEAEESRLYSYYGVSHRPLGTRWRSSMTGTL